MQPLFAFSRYYQDFKIEKNGESNLTQLYTQVNILIKHIILSQNFSEFLANTAWSAGLRCF